MDYQITEKLIHHNRSGKLLQPMGIVIHSTATLGATAENEQHYFDSDDRHASAHYFVDWNEIVRCIPENEVAWHAGPTANRLYLGIEMCEPRGFDVVQFQQVWDNTLWLVKDISRRWKWSELKIFSHREIHIMYGDTSHIDPDPYFDKYNRTWRQFKNEIGMKIIGLS